MSAMVQLPCRQTRRRAEARRPGAIEPLREAPLLDPYNVRTRQQLGEAYQLAGNNAAAQLALAELGADQLPSSTGAP